MKETEASDQSQADPGGASGMAEDGLFRSTGTEREREHDEGRDHQN
jgi:hypothetical protein